MNFKFVTMGVLTCILCFSLPVYALYAIVTPMPIEASYIRSQMQNMKELNISGINYLQGYIHHQKVISVVTGYGKVNVVTVVSRLIQNFHPNAIILSESSGAINPNLPIGAVVVGSKVFDADLGRLTAHGPTLPGLIVNPINHKKEPLIYYPGPHLLQSAKYLIRHRRFSFPIIMGVIADSDFLPNPSWQIQLLRQNHVQAVAMDGASVAKLCWLFNTPCIILHGISNVAGQAITKNGTLTAADNSGKVAVAIINEHK